MIVRPSSPSCEVELKFLVSPSDAATIRANPIFAHKAIQAQLRSVYYDTPAWDLRESGFSLRVRHEDGVFTQTVKSAAGLGLFDRDQWESEIKGKNPDRSAWARTPVADILSAQGVGALRPVFTTTVQRTVRLLNEGVSVVEASFDRGELAAGKLREPIEEVELELKSGEAAALFVIARRLAADTALRLSFASKAERGYQLIGRDGLMPHAAQCWDIPSNISAFDGFARVARSCLAQVSRSAERLRQVKNPEVLHQLRVSLRRLRVAFATFKPILPREGLDPLKGEIIWLGNELDPARDLDVFIEHTLHAAKAGARGDAMRAAFDRRLIRAQTNAYARARAALASNRFAMLLLNCAEYVATAPRRQGDARVEMRLRDDGAAVLAAHALKRFRHELHKRGKHLRALDPSGRHRVRIESKKLRYAVEFFTETFGKKTYKRRRKFIATLNVLQNTLGALNDMATARKTALAVVGNSVPLAFCAGQVVAQSNRDESRLLEKAVHAYKRWWKVGPFWT